MITSTTSVVDFDKASLDFHCLLDCFIEVLENLGQEPLARHIGDDSNTPIGKFDFTERAIQA